MIYEKDLYFSCRFSGVCSSNGVPFPVSMSIFNRIIATDNGFYVGYVGYVSNGKDIPTSEDMSIKQILHFTWDGKPDYVYILDKSIQDFAIDTESGVVYCLTASPEPDIVSYML